MRKIELKKLADNEIRELQKRPAINNSVAINAVTPILQDIKAKGLSAVLDYSKQFDNLQGENILVNKTLINDSEFNISKSLKSAIDIAAANIKVFHEKQYPLNYSLETMPGVNCSKEYRAIENVGLYIPGGTAVLPSTLLMLGIPAKIADCKRVIACSPAKEGLINNAVLYAAKVCGIDELYKVGGAQSIALMAYGIEEIGKVDKIFGPGNQYVTAAKNLVSIDPDGCAIDMPAGPSEVLVIADEYANPTFVAADMLSQAEHGVDSQSILVTYSESVADRVIEEINKQVTLLERASIAKESLRSSFILIVEQLDEAINFSNGYAPEHLILNVQKPQNYLKQIVNAGSVFLGEYSPESVGDYASGTNHSLPTYGYAKSFSGVNVLDFMKGITFQNLTKAGLENISKTVIELAETEKLLAHANAVKVRLQNDY